MFLFYFQNLVESEASLWKQCFELSGMNVEHIGQVTVFLSLFDISWEPLPKREGSFTTVDHRLTKIVKKIALKETDLNKLVQEGQP